MIFNKNPNLHLSFSVEDLGVDELRLADFGFDFPRAVQRHVGDAVRHSDVLPMGQQVVY